MSVPTITKKAFTIRSPLSGTAWVAAMTLAGCLLTQPAQAYRYQCSEYDTECVKNYNAQAQREGEVKNIDLVRVVHPNRQSHSMGAVKSKARQLINFYEAASQGQLQLKIGSTSTVEVNTGNCRKAKNQAIKPNKSDTLATIYVMPKGLCKSSNAGNKRAFLNDNLFRSYAHEVGHIMGLAHSNRLNHKNGKVDHYGDASSYMGRMPATNYSIPQLHWLGWTDKRDVRRIDSQYLDQGGYVEVTIRPVDRNADRNSDIPLSYVYELPNNQRLFIAIPKSTSTNVNRIKGGEVFFYKARECKGCRGISMNSLQIKRIGNPRQVKDYRVADLVVTPVSYESERIKRKGGGFIEKFRSVTLKIRKADSNDI